ncbi:hypothetical protein [Paraburkholderia aromaticivorans]|uniref:Uncharacterized protein n=1 Tax=Paraburkholderia aromaticivorans TaxID=2026199 RepID=A0A248VRN2_9BURK|nr:hypothetical protein [Paraburkholderia aromaticivorans]ASW01172.1 hypothetical protein CJU94_23525 [Paraburkholderia aromaticivorans]
MSAHSEAQDRTATIAPAGHVLRTSAVMTVIAISLAGCGGGGESEVAANPAAGNSANPAERVVNPHVVSLDAPFRGKTYSQWAVSFWRWALELPLGPLPHPFDDCNHRPISAAQMGNVWYWATPNSTRLTCNQVATTIPAGTSLFLSLLDGSSIFLPMAQGTTSLNDPPIRAFTADQLKIVSAFASDIQGLFCTIDGVSVANITAYRTKIGLFSFSAPSPWIFGHTGGKGSSAADGYYLLLEPLSAGLHTIHYGGKFVIPAGVFGSDQAVIDKDVTLLIRVGS